MPRPVDEFEIEDASIGFSKQRGGNRPCLTGLDDRPKFKPEKGKSYDIIVVPFRVTELVNTFHEDCRNATPGRWYYEQSFLVHQKVGPNNDSHTCLARTYGAPCPVCEDVRRLSQSAHKLDKELAAGLKPKSRQLFLVWDLGDREAGVKWWEEATWNFGRHLKEFIGGARKQDHDRYLRFYHPRDGYELRITATERAIGGKGDGDKGGTNTEYVVNGFYPMAAPIPDSILHHGLDLSACVRRLPYSQLKAIYEGRVEGGDAAAPASANGHGDRRDADRARDGESFGQRAYPDDRGHAAGSRLTQQTGYGPRNESAGDDPPARRSAPDPDPEPAPRQRAAVPARAVEPDLPPFSKGDQVTFAYRGNEYAGEIVTMNHDRKIAQVQVADYERPHTVPFEDMKPAEEPEPAPRQRGRAADPDPEPEPVRRGAAKPAPASEWDDEPEPVRPAARNPAPPPPGDDDDDGRSFRRNTRTTAAPAADPDPEPAPKARGRGKAADPDPEPAPAKSGRGRAAPAPADDGDDAQPPPRKKR